MKKIGIYGSIFVGDVKDKSIDYIAVDQGVMNLLNLNIKPIFVIGDLDSLEDKSVIEDFYIKVFPAIKDDTDTALALKEAIHQGYDTIDLYGVTHKRLDHFMAILCLLKKYADVRITIYDEYNKIYLLKQGEHYIFKDEYTYFSLFAFQTTTISLKDCHYPLEHYVLTIDDPLCVSNQMNQDKAYIQTNKDILFIQSK